MKSNIFCGDSLEVLKQFPDNHFDAVVTDPPYGLGQEPDAVAMLADWVEKGHHDVKSKRGFMGKEWDAFVPQPVLWAEVYRVLKPGGHVLAFAGTRTQDLMCLGLRLAGFEIRDLVAWVYGCLDETSEVLTANGWKLGIDVKVGELVAAWDHETGAIRLSPVEETFRAPFKGRMVAFKNDNTDQLLTPNHRVYARHRQREMVKGVRSCWYEKDWKVVEAGEFNRWNPIQLPLAGEADGPGIGGEDFAALLGWVWTEGHFDKSGRGVRIYQSESANPEKVAEIDALVGRMIGGHKRYDRTREWVYGNTARDVSETTWFFTGPMAERVRAALPKKRPTWDLLWQMTLTEKRAFYDAAMKGDGSGAAFYQDNPEDRELFQALCHLIGKQARINASKKCLSIHDNPKTELQARHLRHDGEEYDGDVWCVRVDTGAFLARRNGRAFITGNSGFPKSLNVGKAIEAFYATGSSSPTGQRKAAMGENYKASPHAGEPGYGTTGNFHEKKTGNPGLDVSHPAAMEWEGWGTALKPALEPITLARKPLDGTVAATVLKWRTGAINVDGCKVGAEGGTSRGGQAEYPKNPDGTEDRSQSWARTGHAILSTGQGRWPSNFIHDGSDEVVELFPQTGAGHHPKAKTVGFGEFGGGASTYEGPGPKTDKGSAARFFYCAKASKKDREEGLDDFETVPSQLNGGGIGRQCSVEKRIEEVGENAASRKNPHPTVKPTALMSYLCRLITPPGGLILDPFMGSGSTGKAAVREGFDFVGIDLSEEFCRIAEARIAAVDPIFAIAEE